MHHKFMTELSCGMLVLAAMIPGCGGSDMGGEIRVPAGRQHALQPDQIDAGPLNLPGETGFNIHIKESSQNPGADGSASGSSDATANGRAFCEADASDGGSASAQFNIGHRIINRTDSAHSVRIELAYQLEQSIEASPVPEPNTLATAQMNLVIVDSQKRSVGKMVVVNATSDEAKAAVSSRDRRSLTVRFEPGRWYDVMLFGKVVTSTEADQKASARLEVKEMEMHMTFSPAATQPAEN